MAAGRYSFLIEQGATFQRQVKYTDSSGQIVDLAGYGARMQIRPTVDSNIVLVSLTDAVDSDGSGLFINAASGTINVVISAASSSYLSFTEATYDLEIFSGSGTTEFVTRLLEGNVKLKKNVTR